MIRNHTQTRSHYSNFGRNHAELKQIQADLQRNDDTSFMDWMLEQYEDFVSRLIRVTKYQIDTDDAREIVLDGITKFKDRATATDFKFDNIESFLMVICIRNWYKVLRSKGKEIPSGDIFVEGNAIYLEAEPDTTPQELENERERLALMEGVRHLREDYRLIAEECYLKEKPTEWKEIAEKLSELDIPNRKTKEVSESSAKKRWADTGFPTLIKLCNRFLNY